MVIVLFLSQGKTSSAMTLTWPSELIEYAASTVLTLLMTDKFFSLPYSVVNISNFFNSKIVTWFFRGFIVHSHQYFLLISAVVINLCCKSCTCQPCFFPKIDTVLNSLYALCI